MTHSNAGTRGHTGAWRRAPLRHAALVAAICACFVGGQAQAQQEVLFTANYRDATLWLYARGFKCGCMEEMENGDWVVTLEGEDAKRAVDEDYPIEPTGYRLSEIQRYG